MSATLTKPTVADYQAIFDAERVKEYPIVDAFEQRMAYAIDRSKLEAAARVLACPLKKSPPNWQHGRVLYAVARKYWQEHASECHLSVDIGTAKGFSALCAVWARLDSEAPVSLVWSCDVIDPDARVSRNTVAEVDGLKTLSETLEPWPEAISIEFWKMTGVELLKHASKQGQRIGIAFVDGKHSGHVVAEEGHLLSLLQRPGDLVIFDDVHLDDVNKAVISLSDLYELETLRILPNRAYAIGVRRG